MWKGGGLRRRLAAVAKDERGATIAVPSHDLGQLGDEQIVKEEEVSHRESEDLPFERHGAVALIEDLNAAGLAEPARNVLPRAGSGTMAEELWVWRRG